MPVNWWKPGKPVTGTGAEYTTPPTPMIRLADTLHGHGWRVHLSINHGSISLTRNVFFADLQAWRGDDLRISVRWLRDYQGIYRPVGRWRNDLVTLAHRDPGSAPKDFGWPGRHYGHTDAWADLASVADAARVAAMPDDEIARLLPEVAR